METVEDRSSLIDFTCVGRVGVHEHGERHGHSRKVFNSHRLVTRPLLNPFKEKSPSNHNILSIPIQLASKPFN